MMSLLALTSYDCGKAALSCECSRDAIRTGGGPCVDLSTGGYTGSP